MIGVYVYGFLYIYVLGFSWVLVSVIGCLDSDFVTQLIWLTDWKCSKSSILRCVEMRVLFSFVNAIVVWVFSTIVVYVVLQAYDQHLNMILGDVEEVVTTVEIDDETYEEIVRVCCRISILEFRLCLVFFND